MRVLLCHSYYQCRGGEDVSFEQEADLLEGAGHDVLRFTKRNDAVAAMGAAELAVRTVWNRSVARELAICWSVGCLPSSSVPPRVEIESE